MSPRFEKPILADVIPLFPDQHKTFIWLKPERVTELLGISMDELERRVNAGAFTKPEQIDNTIEVGWRVPMNDVG